MTATQDQALKSPEVADNQTALPTFMDHVRELQGRLFSIAIVFLIVAGAAYPFFDLIVNFLVAPLGDKHELVYLTPGGAFSFIIKVCMYVGLIGSLPFIIYHCYRFLLPAVKVVNIRRALTYTLVSMFLALLGLSFAYYISLPAALYFLTSFDLHHINPMLTIDSYFSFVMTYMLAGALLFQLPLVITIINTIKPLTPGGMMKYQRHLILGSFIIAAIISPTPDALNQALLAMPVVIMYQASIGIVWYINRQAAQSQKIKRNSKESRSTIPTEELLPAFPDPVEFVPIAADRAGRPKQVPSPNRVSSRLRPANIDGFSRGSVSQPARSARLASSRRLPVRQSHRPDATMTRGIDGFMMPSSQT